MRFSRNAFRAGSTILWRVRGDDLVLRNWTRHIDFLLVARYKISINQNPHPNGICANVDKRIDYPNAPVAVLCDDKFKAIPALLQCGLTLLLGLTLRFCLVEVVGWPVNKRDPCSHPPQLRRCL